MKIIVLTAIHGRHELSLASIRQTLRAAAAVAPALTVRIVAVLSRSDVAQGLHRELEILGVVWQAADNEPVSGKWQAGLDRVADMDRSFTVAGTGGIDAVMTLGSDDFITAAYLDRCRVLLEQDPARGFGPDAVWMYNAQTGELGHCTRKYEMPTGNRTPIGAGRVYTRELLQRAAWRLWTLPANRGLDGMASRRLFALGYRLDQVNMAAIPGAAIVDYKSGQPGENLNEWAGLEFSRVLPVTQAAVQLLQWGLSQALPKTADAKANA